MLYTFLSASRNIKGNGKAQKKRLKNIPNEEKNEETTILTCQKIRAMKIMNICGFCVV